MSLARVALDRLAGLLMERTGIDIGFLDESWRSKSPLSPLCKRGGPKSPLLQRGPRGARGGFQRVPCHCQVFRLSSPQIKKETYITEAAMLVSIAADVRISYIGGSPYQVRAAMAREIVGM